MTATMTCNIAAARTLEWVRLVWMTRADAGMAKEIGGVKETRRVAQADEAILADVRAAASGDGDAYGRIIGRYQETIARRMLRFTRDEQMLEELVHDVFVEAYFSLSGYRGDAPLEHWLQRIATRVGYRYWTRRGREQATVDVHLHEPESQATTDQQANTEEVAAALAQLGPRDRLVLTLLYLESRSVAEAADLAGWSETMVKVQAHRARKRFRKLLELKEQSDG
jgi:RNA polymerase sigma-70 factor, ECF subfamily